MFGPPQLVEFDDNQSILFIQKLGYYRCHVQAGHYCPVAKLAHVRTGQYWTVQNPTHVRAGQ